MLELPESDAQCPESPFSSRVRRQPVKRSLLKFQRVFGPSPERTREGRGAADESLEIQVLPLVWIPRQSHQFRGAQARLAPHLPRAAN